MTTPTLYNKNVRSMPSWVQEQSGRIGPKPPPPPIVMAAESSPISITPEPVRLINNKSNSSKNDPDYEVIEFSGQQYSNEPMIAKATERPKSTDTKLKCTLCGSNNPWVICDACSSQIFCASCDDMFHKHPKRREHVRKAVEQSRPPLPPKASSTSGTPPIAPPRRNKRGLTPLLPRKEQVCNNRSNNHAGTHMQQQQATIPLSPTPSTISNATTNSTLNERLGSLRRGSSLMNRPLPDIPKTPTTPSDQASSSRSTTPKSVFDTIQRTPSVQLEKIKHKASATLDRMTLLQQRYRQHKEQQEHERLQNGLSKDERALQQQQRQQQQQQQQFNAMQRPPVLSRRGMSTSVFNLNQINQRPTAESNAGWMSGNMQQAQSMAQLNCGNMCALPPSGMFGHNDLRAQQHLNNSNLSLNVSHGYMRATPMNPMGMYPPPVFMTQQGMLGNMLPYPYTYPQQPGFVPVPAGYPMSSRQGSRLASPAMSRKSLAMRRKQRNNYVDDELTDDEDSDEDDRRSIISNRSALTNSSRIRPRRMSSASQMLNENTRDIEAVPITANKQNARTKYRQQRRPSVTKSLQGDWVPEKSTSVNATPAMANTLKARQSAQPSSTVAPSKIYSDLESEGSGARALVQAKIQQKLKEEETTKRNAQDANNTPRPNTNNRKQQNTVTSAMLAQTSESNSKDTSQSEDEAAVEEKQEQTVKPAKISTMPVEAEVSANDDADSAELGPPPSTPDYEWTCEFCTFVNEPNTKICGICCKTPTTTAAKKSSPCLDGKNTATPESSTTARMPTNIEKKTNSALQASNESLNNVWLNLEKDIQATANEVTAKGIGKSQHSKSDLRSRTREIATSPTPLCRTPSSSSQKSTERKEHVRSNRSSSTREIGTSPPTLCRTPNAIIQQKQHAHSNRSSSSRDFATSPCRTTSANSHISEDENENRTHSNRSSDNREIAASFATYNENKKKHKEIGTSPPPQTISTQTYETVIIKKPIVVEPNASKTSEKEVEPTKFTMEEFQIALKYSGGTIDPMHWLRENWQKLIQTVESLSTMYGQELTENTIGTISQNEAREALRLHNGNIWQAVSECIEDRRKKFNFLSSKGHFLRDDIVTALTTHHGNLEAALLELERTNLKPFLMRIWGSPGGVENESSPAVIDQQAAMFDTFSQERNIEKEFHDFNALGMTGLQSPNHFSIDYLTENAVLYENNHPSSYRELSGLTSPSNDDYAASPSRLKDIEAIINNLERSQATQNQQVLQTIEGMLENFKSKKEQEQDLSITAMRTKSPITTPKSQSKTDIKSFVWQHIQDIVPSLVQQVEMELLEKHDDGILGALVSVNEEHVKEKSKPPPISAEEYIIKELIEPNLRNASIREELPPVYSTVAAMSDFAPEQEQIIHSNIEKQSDFVSMGNAPKTVYQMLKAPAAATVSKSETETDEGSKEQSAGQDTNEVFQVLESSKLVLPTNQELRSENTFSNIEKTATKKPIIINKCSSSKIPVRQFRSTKAAINAAAKHSPSSDFPSALETREHTTSSSGVTSINQSNIHIISISRESVDNIEMTTSPDNSMDFDLIQPGPNENNNLPTKEENESQHYLILNSEENNTIQSTNDINHIKAYEKTTPPHSSKGDDHVSSESVENSIETNALSLTLTNDAQEKVENMQGEKMDLPTTRKQQPSNFSEKKETHVPTLALEVPKIEQTSDSVTNNSYGFESPLYAGRSITTVGLSNHRNENETSLGAGGLLGGTQNTIQNDTLVTDLQSTSKHSQSKLPSLSNRKQLKYNTHGSKKVKLRKSVERITNKSNGEILEVITLQLQEPKEDAITQKTLPVENEPDKTIDHMLYTVEVLESDQQLDAKNAFTEQSELVNNDENEVNIEHLRETLEPQNITTMDSPKEVTTENTNQNLEVAQVEPTDSGIGNSINASIELNDFIENVPFEQAIEREPESNSKQLLGDAVEAGIMAVATSQQPQNAADFKFSTEKQNLTELVEDTQRLIKQMRDEIDLDELESSEDEYTGEYSDDYTNEEYDEEYDEEIDEELIEEDYTDEQLYEDKSTEEDLSETTNQLAEEDEDPFEDADIRMPDEDITLITLESGSIPRIANRSEAGSSHNLHATIESPTVSQQINNETTIFEISDENNINARISLSGHEDEIYENISVAKPLNGTGIGPPILSSVDEITKDNINGNLLLLIRNETDSSTTHSKTETSLQISTACSTNISKANEKARTVTAAEQLHKLENSIPELEVDFILEQVRPIESETTTTVLKETQVEPSVEESFVLQQTENNFPELEADIVFKLMESDEETHMTESLHTAKSKPESVTLNKSQPVGTNNTSEKINETNTQPNQATGTVIQASVEPLHNNVIVLGANSSQLPVNSNENNVAPTDSSKSYNNIEESTQIFSASPNTQLGEPKTSNAHTTRTEKDSAVLDISSFEELTTSINSTPGNQTNDTISKNLTGKTEKNTNGDTQRLQAPTTSSVPTGSIQIDTAVMNIQRLDEPTTSNYSKSENTYQNNATVTTVTETENNESNYQHPSSIITHDSDHAATIPTAPTDAATTSRTTTAAVNTKSPNSKIPKPKTKDRKETIPAKKIMARSKSFSLPPPTIPIGINSVKVLQQEILLKQNQNNGGTKAAQVQNTTVRKKSITDTINKFTKSFNNQHEDKERPTTSNAIKFRTHTRIPKKKYHETCFSDDDYELTTDDDDSKAPLHRKQSVPVFQTYPSLIESVTVDPEALAARYLNDKLVCNEAEAQLAAALVNMKFPENAALLAAKECNDLDQAIAYLRQECELCMEVYAMNEIVSMLKCTHKCCKQCAKQYFTVQITERSINDCSCPYCKMPELDNHTEHEDEHLEYFSNLDIFLKSILDEEVHELFQRKLRDRSLLQDPNFKWCIQCSSGFFARPKQKRLICPDCGSITCAQCRKPWEAQHEGVPCDAYLEWKAANDPELQIKGVQEHLAQNGIDCPKCKFRFSLARGGCMHFTCTQCKYEFCYGCGKPFMMGAKCNRSPYCAKLGLHAHHPRNCLFYLRDKLPLQLQFLLKQHGVSYDVEPVANAHTGIGNNASTAGAVNRCPIPLQKETPQGLVDTVCSNDVPEQHAGMCRLHYVEYLTAKVAKAKIDPLPIFDLTDCVQELRRRGISLPERGPWDTDEIYKKMCADVIKQRIPLDSD